MNLKTDPIFTLDVESIGLHGEGYAVGFVVTVAGREVDRGCYSCLPENAAGFAKDREWVRENIPAIEAVFDMPLNVRSFFWKRNRRRLCVFIPSMYCNWWVCRRCGAQTSQPEHPFTCP